MITRNIKPHNNTHLFYLIENLKSKDKKIRYHVLNDIMKLFRSKKRTQKAELLKILNEKNFNEMEKRLLYQVMEVSKSMIESFKFRMIYGLKVTKEQNHQTIKALHDFRAKNWDKSISRKEAYNKYLNLYH